MKKFAYLIISILLFSSIASGIHVAEIAIKSNSPMNSSMSYTHTVFAGVVTGQFCEPCDQWGLLMYNTYNSGSYDFHYVEMITHDYNGQKLNLDADDWRKNYSIYAFPTTVFDGDYTRIQGNQPSELPNALNTCGNRAVTDISAQINVSWLGNATIKVKIIIQNHEQSQYTGLIRAFITEIVSRYKTYYGNDYHYGFLDYAFNKEITVNAGGSYFDSVTWNGNLYHDNHGNYFGDIVPDNIQVTMAIYNNINGYVDETVMGRITNNTNNPPYEPTDPEPENNSVDVDVDAILSWNCSDPDGDILPYDVYFEANDPTPDVLVSNNQSVNYYDPGIMNDNTTFYWQIVAWDIHGASTTGPVWQFTTGGPNNPPNIPSNPIPSNGATNVGITDDLNWIGGDPDPGDTVTYDVYFEADDPTPDILVSNNQSSTTYDPGTMTGNTQYYWQIISWDNHGISTTGPIWNFTTENQPPNSPSNPTPNNHATNVDINADISWTCSDPDPGDTLTYDVYFEPNDPTPDVLVSNNQTSLTFDPGTMNYNTHYYWQIIAWDLHGAYNSSPIWDFTTGSEPNDPPEQPSNPTPEDDETDVDLDADLSWTCSDPDGDDLVYDVYFEANNPNPTILASDDQAETTYNPGTMSYGTDYYWKIVAKDEHSATTTGPIWHFTTKENTPPNIPTITGPNTGKPNTEYDFTLNSIDPDGDDVRFHIDWGDGDIETTTFINSGTDLTVSHSWTEIGTYTITAYSEDEFDAESDWSIPVLMIIEKSKTINNPFLNWLYSHPNMFPILQLLIQKLGLQ
jgi:outer membrane lipoprotein-sorting protein